MSIARRVAPFAVALLLAAAPALAQQNATPTEKKALADDAFKADEPGTWANADLSYVLTSGNSSSNTLGLKGEVLHRFGRSSLRFAGGALRASSSQSVLYAVGTPGDYELVVPEAEPTAEYYFGRARYDYKLSNRLFYTVGTGWERNRFSGIDNRWVVDTGLGYVLVSSERTDFRSAAAITYTSEDFTVDDGRDGSYVGARLGWDLRHQLFANTTLTHTLIADENLEDTDDLRVDAQLGLQVAMNARLALKLNYRLMWDNQPALAEVPLSGPGGQLTVRAPYKETDQGFSVSLVFSLAPPKKS